MRLKTFLVALAIALIPIIATAQSLSGTVTGTVVDAQGAVLPGVNVTLTGRTGSVTQVTDADGTFRFVGLTPGNYNVVAELTGFRPYREDNIDLGIGRTVTLKVGLQLGGLTESVEVTAGAIAVDTTSTATDTTIGQDLLFAMPFSRTNAAVNLLNVAPGVNSGSAFGGSAGSGNALLLDGVDTRDPEGGTAWTFFNYNIIDEVQIGALGQPAEYGGFTGAVVNTLTKSGGNRYSSLFEYRTTTKDLRGDNVSDAVKRENPALAATGVDRLNDYTVQLGGPLRRNRAFFFASIQRYSIRQDPDGPRTIRTEVSPRFNTKLTFQPNDKDNIVGTFQYDQYNQTGRTGLAGVAGTTDELTVEQDSPEFIWNGQYRRILGSSSFFEAKFTGYWGYFDLDPKTPVSAHLNDDGQWSGGAGYSAKYDRFRNQLNASMTRYVQAAGQHNFKFGVEIERSTIRNRSAYTDDVYYYDIGGEPYLAYSYSYDVKGTNKRQTLYAQDQWTIGRFTANLGVRFDGIGGNGDDGNQYYSTNSWGPRLGLAWDVTGRANSVLRAFYGQLYEGAVFSSWNRAVPGIGDFITYEVFPGNRLVEIDRVSGESKYVVDEDLKHPRTNEFNLSYEQQLRGRMKATVTYIRRDSDNFINSQLIDGVWSPVSVNNPKTNQPMTVFRWANRTGAGSVPQRFRITNVDEVTYPGLGGTPVGSADTTRKYNGVMLVLSKALSHRWQGQISYVFSQTEGRVSSASQAGFASSQFETPNNILVNREGPVPLDRPHEFKAFIGYQIPVVEVALNAAVTAVSGQSYTPFFRFTAGTINWTTSNDVFIEPQGSYRNDPIRTLDLRLEKVFSAGVNRFGVYLDAENVFNAGTVSTRQTRYPGAAISGTFVDFGDPTAVISARQLTFGARWSF
jgi:hypothetical protein